jgi:hypothetical protein
VRLVDLHRHEHGPRVFVFGRRSHHGLAGVALLVIGVALIIHDRHDWPWIPHRRDHWSQQ